MYHIKFQRLYFQFIKKANRQERVVEEVKLAIKPHYNKGRINKDEYKDIMRRAVPKVRPDYGYVQTERLRKRTRNFLVTTHVLRR